MKIKKISCIMGLSAAMVAFQGHAVDSQSSDQKSKTRPMITVLAMNDAGSKTPMQETKQGVKSALNRTGQAAEDVAISAKLKAQMVEDPALSADDINVDTAGGVVTLSGTVMSEEAKDHATKMAGSVEGVLKVDNRLKVGQPESLGQKTKDMIDDSVITAKVKAKLIAEKSLSAAGINVDTAKGVVTLSGSVASETDKDMAETIAAAVPGVHTVDNRLTIS